MPTLLPTLRLAIGKEIFSAQLRRDLAPLACAHLERLLPYRGKIIHARWSGEALWSPLEAVWPTKRVVPPENSTASPAPGQILLYSGETSEPELLLAYGAVRFACRAGSIAGNPVLTIQGRRARLAELGREVLWRGAMDLWLECTESLSLDSEERAVPPEPTGSGPDEDPSAPPDGCTR